MNIERLRLPDTWTLQEQKFTLFVRDLVLRLRTLEIASHGRDPEARRIRWLLMGLRDNLRRRDDRIGCRTLVETPEYLEWMAHAGVEDCFVIDGEGGRLVRGIFRKDSRHVAEALIGTAIPDLIFGTPSSLGQRPRWILLVNGIAKRWRDHLELRRRNKLLGLLTEDDSADAPSPSAT